MVILFHSFHVLSPFLLDIKWQNMVILSKKHWDFSPKNEWDFRVKVNMDVPGFVGISRRDFVWKTMIPQRRNEGLTYLSPMTIDGWWMEGSTRKIFSRTGQIKQLQLWSEQRTCPTERGWCALEDVEKEITSCKTIRANHWIRPFAIALCPILFYLNI